LEFAIQFSCHLVIFVCVACILDSPRVPSGILEAGKIAPQANPVNSGVHTGGKNADQFASAVTNRERPCMATNQLEQSIFLFFLGHARFLFLVKKIFSRGQKIKFIFFLSILKRVSSLKPAGEDGNKAHVNKL
jgi:hypothetical protein